MKHARILVFAMSIVLLTLAACSNSNTANTVADDNAFYNDSQYTKELEQGHHTDDLSHQDVLMSHISEKGYDIDDFEAKKDEDMLKTYTYLDSNIEIHLVAHDIETSKGDVVRVWEAKEFLYFEF